MGSAHSVSISRLDWIIETSDKKTLRIPYGGLGDHIVLLRQVIAHPEMTQEGEILNNSIKEYCKRMSEQVMATKYQQRKLPWQIEWIWHVHRLHPVAYNNDCTRQLPSHQIVDKRCIRLKIKEQHQKHDPFAPFVSSTNHSTFVAVRSSTNHLTFVPSLDLASAVIRQRDFLEKFKKHSLFSMDSRSITRISFEGMLQNYISFMKLAKQNELIVPTFDIDLIWHTHMRFPSSYQTVSIALCGFLLDHDDSIENGILTDAYQKTADRWKTTYKLDYGKDIEKGTLKTSQYVSSCALIVTPIGNCGGGCGGGGGGGD